MRDAVLIAGAIGVALAAAAALALRPARPRAAAMALALALAAVLIAIDTWDDERFRDLRESPARIAAGIALVLALVAGLAALVRRRPALLPLLAIAALPFRIPIEAGGESANLLVPLYVVILAGVVATALDALAAPPASDEDDRPAEGLPGLAALWLPRVLAASVVLYALQTSYSRDLSQGLENLCFFYVPFAVLFALLVRLRWTQRLLAMTLAIVVAEAVLFAFVGFTEYAIRDLLWNPQVETANDFHPYFRVNSLFWDPNILARYLAISAVGTVALMLWTRSTRLAVAAAATSVLMLATIGITFSQSGLIALLAGLVVLAALRWSARWTLGAIGALAVAGVALALARGASVDLSLDSRTLDETGRAELIRGGLDLAADRPLAGWGSGSFSQRFERRFASERDLAATEEAAATASHTEPVTMAAEQGAIGLLMYVALVVTAIAAMLAGLGPLAPGLRGFEATRPRGPPASPPPATALAVARASALAGFVAMLVHSLSYAAFLTDPITWALLALGAALVRTPLSAESDPSIQNNPPSTSPAHG
jgi:O-antigen ligase